MSAVPTLTLPLSAKKRPRTEDDIPTLPSPAKKRPGTEDNVNTLAVSVKKLKIKDSVAAPSPSFSTDEAGALTIANPTDVNTSDEMANENMSDDEDSDADYLPCDRRSWGSNSQMSFSSDSSDDEGESQESATAQRETLPILPFDREYISPDDGYIGVSTSDVSGWHEQLLDDKETSHLFYTEGCIRLQRWKCLKLLDATASVPGLEKTDSLSLADANGKPSVSRKGDFSDSYSDPANYILDWMRPDAAGWEAAANGSRLQPEAIKLIVDFFHHRPHLNRTKCEDYCLKKYLGEDIEFATGKRPIDVHAYPSEFQFPDSYMVEIIDPTVSTPTLMTLFYITPKTLDEGQLAQAREAYSDFVPLYTYVGRMGLAHQHQEELVVWRIVAPAGRPIAADIHRLGLRLNQDKYLAIMKQFVDFVCEPLPLTGDGRGHSLDNGEDWPMVPHNPLLDMNNIIVRPDWSGIAGMLLWGAPPLMTLPFGACLSGLLRLEGVPDLESVGGGQRVCELNPSIFETYSRNGRELERLCLYYLRQKIPALAEDPQSWHRLFQAMGEGIAAATHTSEIDTICYATQLDELRWDWFRHEIKADIPDDESDVASSESGSGEESGDDVDMDVD
ncbi:hypothetical protein AYO20_08879 [Fonsecaea nubica]|uniref:Uncharacterized protein n=1 Tax=Fonsecaea nubica TaxID=856822 RepID=A0A178CM46_9EURO|nr:hypothetical protein AYO20_08879 [Fonsecaea nubica]OAL30163.1 hypothetical protein AYO20_08879 [Fonsecaea nubica]